MGPWPIKSKVESDSKYTNVGYYSSTFCLGVFSLHHCGSCRFSRNSHRASLLLSDVSDVSSSILSSLTSVLLPPLPSESDRKKSPQQQPQLKPPSQLNPASLQPSPQPSVSLLDADEEEQTFTTPVMSLRVASTGPRASLSSGSKSKPADTDDEWNW